MGATATSHSRPVFTIRRIPDLDLDNPPTQLSPRSSPQPAPPSIEPSISAVDPPQLELGPIAAPLLPYRRLPASVCFVCDVAAVSIEPFKRSLSVCDDVLCVAIALADLEVETVNLFATE